MKKSDGDTRDFSALDQVLDSLQERAREFNCLVEIEEILSNRDLAPDEYCPRVLEALIQACDHPERCCARIRLGDSVFVTENFRETPWFFTANITVQDMAMGSLSIYYWNDMTPVDPGFFNHDKLKLFNTVAGRLGQHILHQRMHHVFQEWKSTKQVKAQKQRRRWEVVLELMEHTDLNLYLRIARKMLYHLCWAGVAGADTILQSYCGDGAAVTGGTPAPGNPAQAPAQFASEVFRVAGEHMNEDEVLDHIQKWIGEDRLSYLVQVVDRHLALPEVADAVRRYHRLSHDEPATFSPGKRSVQVSLIRRLLSDQRRFINVAKNYIDLDDFHHLLEKTIFNSESHGRLGGKSAGLCLARRIIEQKAQAEPLLADLVVPKTWYISSDVILHFMHYNNLDDVMGQKYKSLDRVRLEYPQIIQTFRRAHFPDEIQKGLSVALDDLEGRPLIVRSSSLLEDCFTVAFPHKYKSVFLANQGTKVERLAALTVAIADVYASTFSPDPIAYRAEKELLDFGEEMGVMIQEVAGTKAGDYYLPAFSGTAHSRKEFHWSPTLKKTGVVVNICPGLGTRVSGALGGFQTLVLTGHPETHFRPVPVDPDSHSRQYIDVINLETREMETHDIRDFCNVVRSGYPSFQLIFSQSKDGTHHRPPGPHDNWENAALVASFDGLIDRTPFLKKMQVLLRTLETTLVQPVTIEFAFDGERYHLLQCRAEILSDQT